MKTHCDQQHAADRYVGQYLLVGVCWRAASVVLDRLTCSSLAAAMATGRAWRTKRVRGVGWMSNVTHERWEAMECSRRASRSEKWVPMSARHTLLGLLLNRSAYPYELADRLERSLGPAWAVNSGELYQTIGRLERDGLIECVDPSARGREDRHVFTITRAGVESSDAGSLR